MREGKVVLGEVMILVLRAGAVGLAELDVGEDLADSRDVGEHAVEDVTPRLVAIEAELEVIAQVAAALRDADGQRGRDPGASAAVGRGVGGALPVAQLVAQERDEIARGRVADAEHLRVPGRIPEVVDEARLETRTLGQQLQVPAVAIRPAGGFDLGRRLTFPGARGQAGARLIERGRLVAERRRRARLGHAGAEDELVTDRSDDRRAGVGGDRHADRHAVIHARRVGIPAAPHDGVALAEHEAVPGVLSSGRIVHGARGRRRLVHERQEELASAIGHLVEELPAAEGGIRRAHQVEVDFVLDEAPGVAGRPVEVDDDGVFRSGRIEVAVRRTRDANVGPGRPERAAGSERLGAVDHDLDDPSLGGPGHEREEDEREDRRHRSAGMLARKWTRFSTSSSLNDWATMVIIPSRSLVVLAL